MKLIDLYIQEVTRRLPEKMRSDIALELRSTIEDMLPGNYREEDVKEVLNELGNPAVLASGYKDQPMHLIGPRYFDLYVSLLKMIVPIAGVISFITVISQNVIGYGGEDSILNMLLHIMGEGIWATNESGIQAFFWLTLTFAIIERVDHNQNEEPLTLSAGKWTADELKNIPYIPKKKVISKFEIFGGFMWTAIWATIYFNANHLVGIYEGTENGLKFVMPAFNQEVLFQYLPLIIFVIGIELAMSFYKLLKAQWTNRMAVLNAMQQGIVTVVFILIITNAKLLNQEFIAYMSDVFSKANFHNWLIGSAICLFIISSAINLFDGFKKARIR